MSNQKDNNPKINNLKAKPNASADEAQRLASEFEQLLIRENSLLESASADNLQEIAAQKRLLVNSLAAIEPQLHGLFDQNSSDTEVQSIKDTLGRCQLQNRDNQRLTHLVLKHTSNSLELLRSLQKMNDLSLYEPTGELNIKREQRHLGSA